MSSRSDALGSSPSRGPAPASSQRCWPPRISARLTSSADEDAAQRFRARAAAPAAATERGAALASRSNSAARPFLVPARAWHDANAAGQVTTSSSARPKPPSRRPLGARPADQRQHDRRRDRARRGVADPPGRQLARGWPGGDAPPTQATTTLAPTTLAAGPAQKNAATSRGSVRVSGSARSAAPAARADGRLQRRAERRWRADEHDRRARCRAPRRSEQVADAISDRSRRRQHSPPTPARCQRDAGAG